MELGLSLGHASKPFTYAEKPRLQTISSKDSGFCMGFSENGEDSQICREEEDSPIVAIDGPVQLDLNCKYSGESPPYAGGGDGGGNEMVEVDRAFSRTSDDDENGCGKKKLRLSKEQSAFLEESFKEQSTLNPKQKLAVANQLNLRPRQVEVWFQNRRARTKLKQTEADCENLKKCCETLTAENRRLNKELQELKALKSNNSLYMQLPATTLKMCPSCKRMATSSAAVSAAGASKSSYQWPEGGSGGSLGLYTYSGSH